MSLKAALLQVSLLSVLAGCAKGGPSDVVDIDQLAPLPVAERLRIGSVEDPDLGFSRVRGVDVDGRGWIYVNEGLDRHIRIYDQDGAFLRTIGGPGEGPGEFGAFFGFGVTGDTVWTIDSSLRRLTLFDTAGKVLSTGRMGEVRVPIQRQDRYGVISPMVLRDDGLFLGILRGESVRGDQEPNGIGPSDTLQVPVVVFEPTGVVVDTIGWETFPPPLRRPFKEVEFRGTKFQVPRPPSDQPQSINLARSYWLVERPIAASAEAGFFRVTRLTYGQDTLWSRRYRYRPKEYSAEALDLLAYGTSPMPAVFSPSGGVPSGGALTALQNQIRDAMDFPSFQPPIQRFMAGEDGILWLRREDVGGAHYRWLVIDPEGNPLGFVDIPRQDRLQWVSRDEYVIAEPDGFDVPWIVCWKVGS